MRMTGKHLGEQQQITVHSAWIPTPLLVTKANGTPEPPLGRPCRKSILHPVMVIGAVFFFQDLQCSVGLNNIVNFARVLCSINPPVPLKLYSVCQTLGAGGGLQRRSQRHSQRILLISPRYGARTALICSELSGQSAALPHGSEKD